MLEQRTRSSSTSDASESTGATRASKRLKSESKKKGSTKATKRGKSTAAAKDAKSAAKAARKAARQQRKADKLVAKVSAHSARCESELLVLGGGENRNHCWCHSRCVSFTRDGAYCLDQAGTWPGSQGAVVSSIVCCLLSVNNSCTRQSPLPLRKAHQLKNPKSNRPLLVRCCTCSID